MKQKKTVLWLMCLLLMIALGNLWAQPKTTLTVLWFNDSNESDVFMATITDYLKSHPNISIDMQVIPFNDYENKLRMMIAGGNPPDVARIASAHVPLFANSLEPLSGKPVFDTLAKSYFDSSLALGRDEHGRLLVMPTEATANGMIVNKTYFKNAGIDVEKLSQTWTWDQWVDAMKKVLKANQKAKYGITVDFSTHRFSTFLYEAGGRFLAANGKTMNFNTPETLDALNFFKKLHDEDLAPKSVWMGSENPQELFQSGLVACHVGGSWLINAYQKNIKDFEWAAVRMPKRKINSSVPGGKFVGVFKNAPNKKDALDLIAVFSDKAHNEQYCRDTFNLSARKDANITYATRSKDFAVFTEELKLTPAYTADDWKSSVVAKLNPYAREQIIEGLLGKQTMEQAAANIQAKGNSYF
ncbi:ABC transporter substrate-binding protein [Gracilinema caldarium]|uniref:Extracellular solute-binding protein family 1 n=1 Tax=Gracilinema caldarium (strain ATCC 51460 / DSM 7334 / H1) TaxID=744872 RepID=F8F1D0_GRAC1|nr:sugar ABC transporter substrate-binding protein [Gracilinema caldarium]AEJ18774.1 extracellular solute-binding protein family 1 [Gracilinema caldarium DSM 7334]